MKHELVRWLCIELNIGMVRGSNLGEPKLNFILLFLVLAWNWRVRGNPSRPSSQGWLESNLL